MFEVKEWSGAEIGVACVILFLGCILLLGYVTSPEAQKSEAPRPPLAHTGIRYLTVTAPCAVDRGALGSIVTAIRERDQEAVIGLIQRDKAYSLAKGVKFDVSTDSEGVSWGFVRSGRNIGENCYVLTGFLADFP
jgi:hypothetical protein